MKYDNFDYNLYVVLFSKLRLCNLLESTPTGVVSQFISHESCRVSKTDSPAAQKYEDVIFFSTRKKCFFWLIKDFTDIFRISRLVKFSVVMKFVIKFNHSRWISRKPTFYNGSSTPCWVCITILFRIVWKPESQFLNEHGNRYIMVSTSPRSWSIFWPYFRGVFCIRIVEGPFLQLLFSHCLHNHLNALFTIIYFSQCLFLDLTRVWLRMIMQRQHVCWNDCTQEIRVWRCAVLRRRSGLYFRLAPASSSCGIEIKKYMTACGTNNLCLYLIFEENRCIVRAFHAPWAIGGWWLGWTIMMVSTVAQHAESNFPNPGVRGDV